MRISWDPSDGVTVKQTRMRTQIVIRSALPVRHGWEEAFREMAKAGDDRLLMGDELLATAWDEGEWEW